MSKAMKPRARKPLYSERLWAVIDRSGRYSTTAHQTRRRAGKPPQYHDGRFAVIRVTVTAAPKARAGAGRKK